MLVVLLVSFMFIFGDLKNFIGQRTPNIYAQVGLTREADYGMIDETQEQYNSCMEFEPECIDKSRKGSIYKLSPDDVKDIFTVLKNPARREVYDKTEIFIRTKHAKKVPTEGQRYMSAFAETSSYTIFIFMTLMLVQQHQQFAKQMTIGLLLVFTYSTVQLKMPKEVNSEENIIIQIVDMLPFLNRFCYFELAYVLKIVLYPSLFNLTLNVSRIIDVEPIIEFKRRILDAQKKLTKSFMPLEMIIKKREGDTEFHEYRDKEDAAMKEEMEKAIEKKKAAIQEAKDKLEAAKVKDKEDAAAIEAGSGEVELTETKPENADAAATAEKDGEDSKAVEGATEAPPKEES